MVTRKNIINGADRLVAVVDGSEFHYVVALF